jgi:apolipoprotein N-acyltransferase
VSAGCFAAAFPPIGWWWLAPGGYFAIVELAWRERTTRGQTLALFVSALALWLLLEAWLTQIALLGCIVLALFMAGYWPLALFLLRRCRSSKLGARLPASVLAPIVLVTVEWLRGSIVMDGYPWFMIGQSLVDTPWAQVAEFGGVPMVSALVVMLTGAAVDCGLGSGAWHVRRAVVVATLALLAGVAAWGSWTIREGPSHRHAGPIILAHQTNIAVSNVAPWPPEKQEMDVVEYTRETLAAWRELSDRGQRIDLIALPETVLPGFGLEEATTRTLKEGGWWPGDRFARIPPMLASATGVPVLVGSGVYIGLAPDGTRWSWSQHFNSAYLVEPNGSRQRYDKVFLTPFGERMPYISAWPWLEEQLLDLSAVGMTFDLDAGSEAVPLNLAWGASDKREQSGIAVPICFEDTVASVVRRMVYASDGRKRADAIVNLSNDGWFVASDAGRSHHELMARWRCIELRVPMVRVANTGMSGGFDSSGARVAGASLAPKRAGSMLVAMELDDRESVYGKVGEVLSPLMCVLTAILVCAPRRRVAGALVGMLALCAFVPLPGCGSDGRGFSSTSSAWSSRPRVDDPSTIRAADAGADTPVAQAEQPAIQPSTDGAPLEMPASAEVVVVESPASEPEAVLGDIERQPDEQPVVMEETQPSRALEIVVAASSSDQPIYRTHALEGLELCSATVVEPIARRLLVDPNDGVRFAVAVIVGKRRLTGCADLVEPLAVDPSDSVRAAALYALVRLGRVVDLTPLAQLAASPNERTRSNALFVLGELRNASAIPLVESVVTRRLEDEDPARRRVVDLQAAEAMAKMGDYRQYDPIRAALYAPPEQGEVVALACQMIGEADDRGARQHLIGLWNEKGPLARPLEIRLIAGASLARIGEPNLEPVIVVAEAALTDPSPSIRAQAVATLGWVGGDRALVAIAPLLSDPVPLVRLAAAVASLRAAKPR